MQRRPRCARALPVCRWSWIRGNMARVELQERVPLRLQGATPRGEPLLPAAAAAPAAAARAMLGRVWLAAYRGTAAARCHANSIHLTCVRVRRPRRGMHARTASAKSSARFIRRWLGVCKVDQ